MDDNPEKQTAPAAAATAINETTTDSGTNQRQPANDDNKKFRNKKRKSQPYKKGHKKRGKRAAKYDDDKSGGGSDGGNKDFNSLVNRGEGKTGQIHPGSYAWPEFRKLFGVELPQYEQELKELEEKRQQQQDGKDDKDESPNETEGEKRVKRKVAFLIAYIGSNYIGFQINEAQRTLQAEFELAAYKARFITAQNFGYPFKYSWSISGRTDKGVHACAQVCSAKIEMSLEQEKDLDLVVEALNQELPDDIRILDVKRVNRSFCAHTARDRVRYQYMIPSFVLSDVSTTRDLFIKAGCTKNERDAGDPISPEEMKVLQPQMAPYRVTPEKLNLLKEVLRSYEGTHSFHNFSKGVKNDEARADRYIVSFSVEDPIVFDKYGTEWIPTQVLGQSFLLHQIRKMICMAIDVTRGAAPLSKLKDGLSRETKMRVAPAPAQGLYLEMSYYSVYNQRKRKMNAELPDLEWHVDQKTNAYKRWHSFRNGVLMPHLVAEEHSEGNFIKWLYQQEFINDYDSHHKKAHDEPADKQEGDQMEQMPAGYTPVASDEGK